jgi:ribosomal protein L11 methyltransferase
VAVTPADADPSPISDTTEVDLRAYLPLDARTEAAQEEIRRGISHLRMITPLPDPQFSIIEEENWKEAWKSHYRPLAIGDRLMIIPSWFEIESPGRVPIRLDPGMAFGTGTHPTTQMCLLALEEYLEPGMFVMDIGCGSGILSIAAALLGAEKVLAADTDREAVGSARLNLRKNGVESSVQVLHGGLDDLLGEMRAEFASADITLVNILSRVITEMLETGLTDTLRPGGLLILSGILEEQADHILAACNRRGLVEVRRYSQDDWRALLLKKRTPH